MVTKDDITMVLYQNIHADEITEAIENGTLLSYFGAIATRLMEMNISPSSVRREEPKKLKVDTQVHGLNATETKSDSNAIRPPTPQPNSVQQSVKVANEMIKSTDSLRVRRDL